MADDFYAPVYGPTSRGGMVPPPGSAPRPTGDTGLAGFAEAPIAGAFEAAGQLGSAVQGGAKLLGADSLADAAGEWAKRRQAQAATYTAPEAPGSAWYSPGNLTRTLLRGAPLVAGGAAAAAASPFEGTLGAGAMAAGAFAPFMFGQNVQTSEAVPGQQNLTKQQAAKAALLAVPEAAVGAVPFGGAIVRGAEQPILHTAATMAAASAAQDAIGQAMGDPNRTMTSRMSEVLQSAVTGGITGGIVGGAIHSISKTPIPDVKNDDLIAATEGAMQPQIPPTGRTIPPPEGGVIPQPDQEHIDLVNQHVADRPVATPGLTPDEMEALPNVVHPGSQVEPEPAAPAADTQARINEPDTQARMEEPPAPAAAAPVEQPPPAEVAPEPKRVPRDAIPPQHQARWDQAEALRNDPQVQKDPLLVDLLDKAQSDLQNPKRGAPQAFAKVIQTVKKAIEAENLKDEAAPNRFQNAGARQLGPDASELPESYKTPANQTWYQGIRGDDQSGYWTNDPAKAKAYSSNGEVRTINESQFNPDDIAKINWSRNVTGSAKGPEEFLQSKPLAGPTPAAQAIAAQTPAARTAGNIPGGAVVKASLDNLRTLNPAPDGATKQEQTQLGRIWQAGLKADPTGLKLWDSDAFDRFSPEAQKALEDHGTTIQNENDKANPGDALGKLAEPQLVRSPQGLDIEHITNNGGSLKDSLDYLSQNGENGDVKTVANLLRRNGVDAKMKVSSEGLEDPRFVAQYQPSLDTITLKPGESNSSTVLHEAIHAATWLAINTKTAAARVMQGLYDKVKAASPDSDAYGLTNLHEFTAEAFSNPDFRDTLRAMHDPDAPTKTSLWQSFKNVVGRLLGARPGAESTMLDRVMETGQRLIGENQARVGAGSPADDVPPLHKMNDKVRDFVAMRGTAAEPAIAELSNRLGSLKRGLQNTVRAALNGRDIANTLARDFGIKSGQSIVGTRTTEEARENAFNKAAMTAVKMKVALSKPDRANVDKAMAITNNKLDPTKEWDAHSQDIRNDPVNAGQLKAVHQEGRRAYLGMSDAGREAYDAMAATRRMQQVAGVTTGLDQYVKAAWASKGLTKGFDNDPAAEYQTSNAAHSDPHFALNQFVKALQDRKVGLDEFAKTAAADKGRGDLEGWSKGIDRTLASLDEPPNFHISHGQGDYFVAGRLPLDKNGRPDEQAIAKLMPRLKAAGFGDKVVEALNNNPGFFARAKTDTEAQKLADVMRKAQADGILDQEHPVKSGLAQYLDAPEMRPEMLKSLIQALKDSKPDSTGLPSEVAKQMDDAHAQHVAEVEHYMMDALSDSSPSKVLATKEYVNGYTSKMSDAFDEGAARSARMLAKMSTTNEMSAGLKGARDEIAALKENKTMSVADQAMAQNKMAEILHRGATRPLGPPSSLVNLLKSVSYKFELASPAYATLLGSQDLTLVLPKLGSRVGYAQAAKSMAATAGDTFKALRGAMMDGTTMGLREENLIAAGLSPAKAKFLTYLDNMGLFNASSQTHLVTPSEEGEGAIHRISELSSGYTLAAEMFPRFHAALAAAHSFDAKGMTGSKEDFATKMVNESSFEFNRATSSRLLSRGGPLGEAAPLLTQFSKFRTELTTRLFREFEDGFIGKAASVEDRNAARKFLLGHLAATTALAGTLGLPMVGVLASVYDKLADWATGDPTHDVVASYRGLLTTMYGSSAGEALARGAPRLIGADMGKAGEGSIVPFVSDALNAFTEKRKLEDAEKDWLKRVAGPSIGLAADWAFGLRDIANGDYLRGLAKMVPEGLRGPVEAAEIAQYGYRDKNGQPLKIEGQTMTPGAQDVIEKVLGIEPAKEQEYDELARTASGLNTRRQLQSTNIQQHLQQAFERGDMTDFQKWAQMGGQDWIEQHPGVQPPIMAFEQQLRQKTMQNAMSLPPGTNRRDFVTRGMLGPYNPH